MSWFGSSTNFASLAKNALKEAQKTIDKALDIKDDTNNTASVIEAKGINAAVSSVTDAATEFFSSWGNLSASSKATENVDDGDLPETNTAENQTDVKPNVVTTAPTKEPFQSNSSSSSALILKESLVDDPINDSNRPSMKVQFLETECSVLALESCSADKRVGSQLLNETSDSYESSVDTSSTSTTIEAAEDLNSGNDAAILQVNATETVEPNSAKNLKEVTTVASDEVEVGPLLILCENQTIICDDSGTTPLEKESHDKEPEASSLTLLSTPLEHEPKSTEVKIVPIVESFIRHEAEDEEAKDIVNEGLSSSTFPDKLTSGKRELDPEACETVPTSESVQESVSQSVELESSVSHAIDFPSTETLEFESEADAEQNSKLSLSSRATSSISVISEDKDSSVSPQISPASQEILGSSIDSPSFEIISLQHVHNLPQQNLVTLDFLPHSAIQQHCPNYQSSLISCQSLQSTPDRGTPLTHSRSNSNTSSSFDRVEDSNLRAHKYSTHGHNFISSNSSSDIEVIPFPLNSNENLHLLNHGAKVRSVAEADTQTEPWATAPEVKEKIVEMLPAKTSAILAEKDYEIQQLREEGEKLSKKQLELSNALKKLRQKEKDTDTIVKTFKSDLVAKNVEVERLVKTLIAKESQDQVQHETISKLNTENRKLANTINQLRSDLEDSKQNATSMKASLEEASIEILQLQNTVSSFQRDTAELDSLTRMNGDLKSRTESLEKEAESLRESIKSNQLLRSSRESELKTQIQNLTQEVHRLENQLADNSSEIADATMPLSLEIEKLQGDLKNSSSLYARKESSLLNKVSELEYKISKHQETENSLKDNETILQIKLHEAEKQMKILQRDNDVLAAELTSEKNVNLNNSKFVTDFSILQDKLQQQSDENSNLRTEKESISSELTSTRNSLEAETKRNQQLSEQLLRVNHSQSSLERVSFSSVPPLDRQDSRNTSPRSMTSEQACLDDVILDPGWQNPCLTPKSYFDSFSSLNYIENLQGHLKQKELELAQLQHEVSQNEKIRKSLNDEIAHLTVNNEELLQRLEKQEGLQQKLTELDQNYNAILQMYGEKVEETDELRMDLQDVKEMYKVQIEQLLKKAS